ncbi:3-oxoacyl-ACP synthase III family protein [Streptomyces sp. E11-3]|uniref:3-oxoacyl-ACP synthase n=1 Tax=Streptomyces sp. E11-3 TaxID=3110112 RepID=UPI003980DA74
MRTAPMHIASIGTALPGPPVDNTTLGKLFGVSDEWVDLFVGTRTRHFARDPGTGEVLCSLADLCAEAADRALAAAGLDASDIDFLLLSTATPDALLPNTASLVADRLGLNYLPVYALQAGCSGALQVLDLGRSLLSVGHRTGLVIGGDVTSRHLDPSRSGSSIPTEELVNYVLFGDGAGAAVLTAEPLGERIAVRALLNQFAGHGRPTGQGVEWRGPADQETGRPMLFEDYKAVEESVPPMSVEILWELLDGLGWSLESLDHLLPPQLSGRMTQRIVDHLAIDGVRETSCVADTGNTGNALPFLQLHRLLPEFETGQRALALVVESSKWTKAGLALEKI